MPQNVIDCPVDHLAKVEKASLVQKYLQNPFSICCSKLADLFQATPTPSQSEKLENDQIAEHEPHYLHEQDLYPHIADRIDPSLYYTIFFCHRR